MSTPGLRLRESPRVEVACRARLLLGAGGTTVDATVLDLSITGMGLATAVAAPKPTVGDVCVFELTVDGARIEGRGVVVWSRRARPDRGDAPNVGVRFQQLEGAGGRDLAALVEPRLAAGRWSGVAEVVLAPSVAVALGPEVASAPAQQLTLTVPAAAPPPEVAPALMVATAVEKPPPPVPREPAPAPRIPAPEPVAQATRPEPSPAPPVTARRSEALEDGTPAVKSRAVMWVALVAAAIVIALLVKFLVAGRGESEAPAAASNGASVNESSGPADAPGAAATTADLPIGSDGATGEALVEEAVMEPASAESAAMAAEAAAIAATSASLAAESQPIEGVAEPATAPVRESAAPVSSTATRDSSATADAAAVDTAPASTRARRVVALDHGVDGSTEVLALRFDVPLTKDDVFAALIGPDPPRYLLRLRGIDRPWRPPELEVGSSLVQRVRTGLHSTPRGPELHIVIDLSTRAVEHSWAIEGDALRVRLTPRAP